MLELIIGTLLAIGVLLGGVKMIESYDRETTMDLNVGFMYYLACGVGVFIIWQNELISGVDFWFLSLLVGYFVLSAFTDIKTLLIYSLFNYAFFVIGVIYSIMNGVDKALVPMMLGAVLVFWVMGVIKVYGGGDSEIFAVSAIFLMNLSSVNEYVLDLLWFFFLATSCSLVISVARMRVTKEKLRTKMPFAPGIGISFIGMVWFFFGGV